MIFCIIHRHPEGAQRNLTIFAGEGDQQELIAHLNKLHTEHGTQDFEVHECHNQQKYRIKFQPVEDDPLELA